MIEGPPILNDNLGLWLQGIGGFFWLCAGIWGTLALESLGNAVNDVFAVAWLSVTAVALLKAGQREDDG